MKKILFVLCMSLLTKITVFCQTKNPLIENKSFIELVKKVNYLTKTVHQSNKKDFSNFQSLENQVRAINSELTIEDCNKEIARILNLPKGFDISTEINSINEISNGLKINFAKDLTETNIQEAVGIISMQREGVAIDFIDDEGFGCKNKTAFDACCGLAVSTAVGASLACSFGIVFIPAYLICQAAVIVAQTASLELCYQSWCK